MTFPTCSVPAQLQDRHTDQHRGVPRLAHQVQRHMSVGLAPLGFSLLLNGPKGLRQLRASRGKKARFSFSSLQMEVFLQSS